MSIELSRIVFLGIVLELSIIIGIEHRVQQHSLALCFELSSIVAIVLSSIVGIEYSAEQHNHYCALSSSPYSILILEQSSIVGIVSRPEPRSEQHSRYFA